MSFPINFFREGTELPTNGSYYVVAANGTFIHKDGKIIKGLVKTKGISDLEDVTPYIKYKLPPIPFSVAYTAKKFFEEVFVRYHSESAVILHYSYNDGYYLSFPKQRVTHSSVKYERGERFTDSKNEPYICVGTIHSHCDFSAYHSGVDQSDESDFDGIHITFGHVNRETFSISCSLVALDNRFLANPTEYIEGIKKSKNAPESNFSVTQNSTDLYFEFEEKQSGLDISEMNDMIEQCINEKVNRETNLFWKGYNYNYYNNWVKNTESSHTFSIQQSFTAAKKIPPSEEIWSFFNSRGEEITSLPGNKEDWEEDVIDEGVPSLKIWTHKTSGDKVFAYANCSILQESAFLSIGTNGENNEQ